MRTIKFRAWLKSKNRFIDTFSVDFCDGKTPAIIYVDRNKIIGLPYDQFVLEQYTGLKDKNGKEIFENDILMKEEEVATNGYIFNNYTVEFYNGWFKGIPGDMSSLLEPEGFEDCEIIGNIHDRRR